MAEAFAPFVIERTMKGLTFYVMEGKNFVRKKSSLTRRKVLYSPQFERTRHYAGLMAKASKIGSLVYNQLPAYWRQFWMYQAFTGEAMKMLKARKGPEEIQALLYERYVRAIVEKQSASIPVNTPVKRAYQKHDTAYWSGKTKKAGRRKLIKQRIMRNADVLGRASKLASLIYRRLELNKRWYYRQLVAKSMELLREEWCEEDILIALTEVFLEGTSVERLPKKTRHAAGGIIEHGKGYHYFVTPVEKRFVAELQQDALNIWRNPNQAIIKIA
jgi:hypothetical protein